MIEDRHLVLVIDRMPAPLVMMNLIACKCSRTSKAPECQCVSNALKCLSAYKKTVM